MFLSINSKLKDDSPELLGGKGAGLVWMKKLGMPVPHAVILPTTVCAQYNADPEATMAAIAKKLKGVKAEFVKEFGYLPLLSVRSGARVSMPGMMDTILNVGLDDDTYYGWEEKLGTECVADSACRLIEMYGSVVKGIDRHLFEGLDAHARSALYLEHTGEEFPDADGQLLGAIEAVFKSWDNERAKVYRKLNNIPDDWGTAVVVQAMVFGNLNNDSCTGVLFTRNPDSGAPGVVGEYLINAQGEDVVAGIRTPDPLDQMLAWNPVVFDNLMGAVQKLEQARQDMQDVEFTVQDKQLYILQTRNAKRSARAAVKLALDFYKEGVPVKTALKRVTAKQFDLAQQSIIDPSFTTPPDFTGIPACSGVVSGLVVRSAQAAIDCKSPCILVSKETTPDDIAGMNAAVGVLTMTGGATSHAAVVARGMDKPCVVGLSVDITNFPAGIWLSIDGATGRVWSSKVPVVDGSSNPDIQIFRQMMLDVAQVSLIGTKAVGEQVMLRIPELAYLPTSEAVNIVMAELASGVEIVLDLSGTLTDHEQSFFSPFQASKSVNGVKAEELKAVQLIAALEKKAKGLKNLTVLTSVCTSLKKLVSATSLEELVMAEKGAKIVWSGDNSKAVAKVLKWQMKEGLTLTSFGVMVEGGYVSERQLIAEMLS